MRTTALTRAAGLIAVLASLAFAVPAQAVTTVGNSLAAEPSTVADLCAGSSCTLVASGDAARTPVSGVIVRWRVKAAAAARTSIALRVVRGTNNTAVAKPQSQRSETLTAPGIATFTTRISVLAGDRIGIDALGENPPIAAFPGSGTIDRWDPALGPNEAGGVPDDQLIFELLLNADVETDGDKDGFGDEDSGQDKCVGTFGTVDGCPAPATPQPPADPAPGSPPPADTGPDTGAGPGPGTGTGTPITTTPPTEQTPSRQEPTTEPTTSLNAAPRITSLQFNATRISFRISEPASVSLLVQRVQPGKRVGARCLKPTSRRRAARKCNRLVRAVAGRTDVDAGLNTARLRRLPTGRYRVRLLSIDVSGRTSTTIRYFRIRR